MAEPLDLEEDLDEELAYIELGSSNSVHDRTQFESKFDFDLSTAGGDRKYYEIDMYMFWPATMAVNSSTYPRETFYSDINHMLRVRTPELARTAGASFAIPALTAAEDYFRSHLDTRRRSQMRRLVVADTKLWGCLLYTELKKLQADVSRAVKRGLILRWSSRLLRRIEEIHREVRRFREKYVWRIRHEPLLLDEEVRRAFLLVDEYVSYRLEAALVSLHRMMETERHRLEDVYNQLEAILTGEHAYRHEHIQSASERQEARKEMHYYRLGLLKKYVSEILFLTTRRVNKDYVYRNVIAALGAALAAAFATLANIQTVQMVTGQDDMGLRLFTVLALGVAAYVFKDRIKDLTKDYFNNKVKTWLPDYDVEMLYTHFDPSGQQVETFLGSSQEYMRYLARRRLPPEIAYARGLGHRAELEPERLESVLHYHKSIRFDPLSELREHFAAAQVRRIHDVLRFDVSRFLAKLDDPKKRLSFFDVEKGVVTIDAPKVYHVNLVLRYTVVTLLGKQEVRREVELERLRMILNKKGIVRIETVLPRGQLGYAEDNR